MATSSHVESFRPNRRIASGGPLIFFIRSKCNFFWGSCAINPSSNGPSVGTYRIRPFEDSSTHASSFNPYPRIAYDPSLIHQLMPHRSTRTHVSHTSLRCPINPSLTVQPAPTSRRRPIDNSSTHTAVFPPYPRIAYVPSLIHQPMPHRSTRTHVSHTSLR